MHLNRKHFFNFIFWLILILFLAFKSFEHTILVHDQGVGVAINEYKIQAQARMNQITLAQSSKKMRSPILSNVFYQIELMRNEPDPYKFIQINDDLTEYIDTHFENLNFSEKDRKDLRNVQSNLKKESIIFHAHLISFNALINRFPYYFFSAKYPQIKFEKVPSINGVIVER